MTVVSAYIGLGSNLNNPPQQLRSALTALALVPETTVLCCSPFYRNPPMRGPDVPEQPDYVNAVAKVHTSLKPERLLQHLQQIETRQGRLRNPAVQWGPRTLDLDIIVYGGQAYHSATLQIPHPGLAQRAFVLYPLYDCAPDLILPDGRALKSLLSTCPADDLTQLTEDHEAHYPQYAASA